MKAWLLRLWNDPGFFSIAARAVAGAVALALVSDKLPVSEEYREVAQWFGILIGGGALTVASKHAGQPAGGTHEDHPGSR